MTGPGHLCFVTPFDGSGEEEEEGPEEGASQSGAVFDVLLPDKPRA